VRQRVAAAAGSVAVLLVAATGVLDWPVAFSGQRFRWIVALAALVFAWRRRWLGPAREGSGPGARAACWAAAGLRVVVTASAFFMSPIAAIAVLCDQSPWQSIEARLDVGPFRQVAVTRHARVSADKYVIARRFHLGPCGVDVPVDSFWSKCPPDVVREGGVVRVSSYAGSVEVAAP
jgi:hypothetical protein